MENNNKNVIIISIIISIIIISLGVLFILFKPQNLSQIEGEKIDKYYETLKGKKEYTFEAISNKNNNKVFFVKGINKSYLEETINGKETKTIFKDGNMYLVNDDEKVYYTYRNNDSNINLIEEILQEIKDSEYEIGKENIDNKTYVYVEIPKITKFVTINFDGSQDIKTKFYFDGDKLAYIKTISDKKEETITIKISDNIENNLFEIPSDYVEK